MRASIVTLALLTGAGVGASAASAERPAVGDPAPALELTTTDGDTLSLDAAEGGHVVIFFRGSW